MAALEPLAPGAPASPPSQGGQDWGREIQENALRDALKLAEENNAARQREDWLATKTFRVKQNADSTVELSVCCGGGERVAKDKSLPAAVEQLCKAEEEERISSKLQAEI